jgi:hypothetical protein
MVSDRAAASRLEVGQLHPCSSVSGMVELVAAVAFAPWAQPLRFRPLPGWQRGASGTFNSSYGPVPNIDSPKESTAWAARGVRYRDRPTADPPVATLSRLPRQGIVVFALIYQSAQATERRIELRLDRARRYPCCDGIYVAGGEYALAGTGPAAAYSVNVRVHFGSPPTRSMRAQAQRALTQLELPRPSVRQGR